MKDPVCSQQTVHIQRHVFQSGAPICTHGEIQVNMTDSFISAACVYLSSTLIADCKREITLIT